MHKSQTMALPDTVDAGQERVVSLLMDPTLHGLPAETNIARIDTHAARVFLAGDRAYKLKRAVTYPFFDYSTLSLRLDACQAELLLNRRTAPDLYLGVGGLVMGADGLVKLVDDAPVSQDGGPHPAVLDYVITMKRFPQAALLDRMARDHALTPELMRNLATVIAEFHDSAEPMPRAPGAEEMAELAGTNIIEMRRHDLFDPRAIARLDQATQTTLARVAGLIDRRRDAGYIRHCHGDLHLRNIVLLNGRPVPFDCVEFGDRIAVTDILYDLAFLLMDLEHRRLRDAANILFNRHLELTGDLAGLALLPLFMSIRAGIRAHLSAAAGMREEAVAYLDLANRLIDPPPARLLAIGGLSGTGKSTLAKALAPDLGPAPGAVILRSDALRKRLAGVAEDQPLPDFYYGAEHSARTYAELAGQAGLVLDGCHAVIADAVFARPEQRLHIAQVGAMAQVPFTGLWLVADQNVAIDRVRRRRGDASDATAELVRRQAAYDLGDMRWEIISASGDAADTAAVARRHLSLS